MKHILRLSLFIPIAAAWSCASTVSVADLPDRPITELTAPACVPGDKTADSDACKERYAAFVTRMTASTVRVHAYRYDPEKGVEEYLGTGIILDDTGLILTAFHVIVNADFLVLSVRRIKDGGEGILYFTDSWTFPAKVAYAAPERDVALLLPIHPQESSRMVPLPIERGKAKEVGMPIWQFGQVSGVSHGTTDKWPMSSAGTPFVMQAKAPVRHGDSGGPVVSKAGKLLGIVLSVGEKAEDGLMYYMPIDIALKALRPWLIKTHVVEVVPKK